MTTIVLDAVNLAFREVTLYSTKPNGQESQYKVLGFVFQGNAALNMTQLKRLKQSPQFLKYVSETVMAQVELLLLDPDMNRQLKEALNADVYYPLADSNKLVMNSNTENGMIQLCDILYNNNIPIETDEDVLDRYKNILSKLSTLSIV